MIEKTINSILIKKLKDWASSITDLDVRRMVQNNTIITGGAIVSLMQNEKPNDYDIYFRNKETLVAVARYYAKQFNDEHGTIKNKIGKRTKVTVIDGDRLRRVEDTIHIDDPELAEVCKLSYFKVGSSNVDSYCSAPPSDKENKGEVLNMTRMVANTPPGRVKMYIQSDGVIGDLKDGEDLYKMLDDADQLTNSELDEQSSEKYKPVFISSNAITLSNQIQVVVRFWGTPEQLHENYDYAHTKAYWCSWDSKCEIPKDVYECVMNKHLKYTGSLYPICSVMRMRKFIQRGWTINAGQILKMAWQISELDLTDIDVLEDQLVGVDSLYFASIIKQLQDKKQDDPNWNISQEYVTSIIDRIF